MLRHSSIFKLSFVAFLVATTSICWGMPAPSHQVIHVHIQEDAEGDSAAIIVTDLGLVGSVVDEWGDDSLDLVPQVGDVLEVIHEEDDDLWEFRHGQSGRMISLYELGFSDLKPQVINEYNQKKEIIQLDQSTYRIDSDGETRERTNWEQGQSVWIVTCRWNPRIQFLLNFDTHEVRLVKAGKTRR